MALGKVTDCWYAVGYLTTDGVVVLKGMGGLDVLLDVTDDFTKSLKGLGGLGEEFDVTSEIKLLGVLEVLDDDGFAVGLSNEADDLSMSILSVYDYLPSFLVSCLDAFLQIEHYGTCGVNKTDVLLLSLLICGWRFAVSTKEHLGVLESVKVRMAYGDESQSLETFAFAAVVNDVAQAVE